MTEKPVSMDFLLAFEEISNPDSGEAG